MEVYNVKTVNVVTQIFDRFVGQFCLKISRCCSKSILMRVSVAGLHHTKFGFYQFQNFLFFVVIVVSILLKSTFSQISIHSYPGCQRLFQRGFRFLSSLYSDPRVGRSWLRPTAEEVSAFGQHPKFPPHARKTSGTQGNPQPITGEFYSDRTRKKPLLRRFKNIGMASEKLYRNTLTPFSKNL